MNGSWLSANAIRTIYCTLDDVFRLRMERFAPSALESRATLANAMHTSFCTLDDVFRLRMKRFAPSAWKAERLLSGSRLPLRALQ